MFISSQEALASDIQQDDETTDTLSDKELTARVCTFSPRGCNGRGVAVTVFARGCNGNEFHPCNEIDRD